MKRFFLRCLCFFLQNKSLCVSKHCGFSTSHEHYRVWHLSSRKMLDPSYFYGWTRGSQSPPQTLSFWSVRVHCAVVSISSSEVHAAHKASRPSHFSAAKLWGYTQVNSLFSALYACIFYSHVQGSYPCFFACVVLFATFCMLQAALSLADTLPVRCRTFICFLNHRFSRTWGLSVERQLFKLRTTKILRIYLIKVLKCRGWHLSYGWL